MSVPPFRPPVPEPLHPFGWLRPAGSYEFRVTQTFDQINPAVSMQPHHALDMGNGHLGAPLYAPADGTVIAEGWVHEPWSQLATARQAASWGSPYPSGWGGIMVVIDHGGGWVTALAHMSRTVVNKGQAVKRGQQVGNLGATGIAKVQGGHCHWDLYHNGTKVDAWPLLEQNWVAPPDTSTSAPESDMPTFGGSAFAVDPSVPRYHLVVGANFRAAPTTKSPSLGVIPAGSVVPVAYWVDGESLNGDDQWAIAWLYVGQYREGFFHRSVLGAPQQAPALDCGSQVKAATAPLQAEITTLKDRIAKKDAYVGAYPKG